MNVRAAEKFRFRAEMEARGRAKSGLSVAIDGVCGGVWPDATAENENEIRKIRYIALFYR